MASHPRLVWKAHYSNARRGALCHIGFTLLSVALPSAAVYALPSGGQVNAGQASIASSGGQTTINQSSPRAIIDWNSFNVDASEAVRFNQPSQSSITLNRIHDANPSSIDGALSANGQVWLVNPNGMLFGRNAQVNVGGLLATSSDIANDRFMAGDDRFDLPGNPHASITNQGSITIANSGLAALVGPNVTNSGLIEARLGKVQLASGDSFTLDLYGDGLLNLKASPAITSQLVSNSGAIIADGGTVALTAAATQDTINSLINMDGVIQANSVGNADGHIVLYAEGSNAVAGNVAAHKGIETGSSTVQVSGVLSASGDAAGGHGGSITVTGDHVTLQSGAAIDVSGDAGGGSVKIGGDFHGQGATPTALTTNVEAGVTINASVITDGNGGMVTVWSDDTTEFSGSIAARGGAQSGNGGYVETSGHTLRAMGTVDAGAAHGQAGTWLLDPNDIAIDQSSCTGTSCSSADTISSTLSGGTNVTVSTSDGSITLSGNITDSSNTNVGLDFEAGTNIVLDNSATITASGTGWLGITFNANTAANGSITMNSGTSISTHGGGITLTSKGDQTLAALNTTGGAGNIAINATSSTADITLTDAITSGQDVSIAAGRNVTQNSGAPITTGAAGNLSLLADGSNYASGTGTLTLGDTLSMGTGQLWLTSGTDGGGSRTDLDLTGGKLTFQGGSIGGAGILGFGNLTLPNLTTTSSIYLYGYTVYGALNAVTYGNLVLGTVTAASGFDIRATANGTNSDITMNGAITSGNDIVMLAGRNITQNVGAPITTGTAGNLSLRAAGGDPTNGTGLLTLNDTISMGTGNLNLYSGSSGGSRADLDLTGGKLTMQGSAIYSAYILGFGALSLPNLSIDGGTYDASFCGGMSVCINSYGNLTLNGISSIGTSSGNTIAITAYGTSSDLTLNGAVSGGYSVSIGAGRNLTQNVGASITTGAAGGLSLHAAGGDPSNGTGLLTLNDTISVGTGDLSLYSGSSGGSRADLDLTGKLTLQGGTINSAYILGFSALTLPSLTITGGSYDPSFCSAQSVCIGTYGDLTLNGISSAATTASNNITISASGATSDITLNDALTGGNAITLSAGRNIVQNSGAPITAGAAGYLSISAAGGNQNSTGTLTLGDNVIAGTDSVQLLSGKNGGGNSIDQSIALSALGASMGAVTITGYHDLSLTEDVISSGAINLQSNSGALSVQSLSGTSINLGSLSTTILGSAASRTLNSQTGTLTAGAISAGTNNLTLEGDNLALGGNLSGTGTLTLEPYTASTTIGVAGSAGSLNLGTATLNKIQSGFAGITIGSASGSGDMAVNGYTWNAPLTLRTGSGDIAINGAQAMGSHTFIADTASGDISIGASGSITSTASGTAITLADSGGDFTNSAGSGALSAASGRWLIYSSDPSDNNLNGLSEGFHRYSCTYGGSCPSLGSGNGLLYTLSPTITVTADDISGAYGSIGALTASYSGYVGTDDFTSALSGAPSLTTNATLSTSGNYNYSATPWTITAAAGGLTSLMGYQIAYASGTLTVSQLAIGAALSGTVEKGYNGNRTAALANHYTLSTPVGGDDVSLTAGGLYDTKDAGNGKNVTFSSLALGGVDAGNYNLTTASLSGASGKIDKAALSVTANSASRAYNTSNPMLTYSYSGLTGGDNASVFSGALYSAATQNSSAGTYAITQGSLSAGVNYAISFTGGQLTVLSAGGNNAASGPVSQQVLSSVQNTVDQNSLVQTVAAQDITQGVYNYKNQRSDLIYVKASLLYSFDYSEFDPHPWWNGVLQ